MKHKKIIAFATALTLVLGFSACKRGKNGDETTARESTAVEESTTSEETTAETTTETESTTEPEKKFVFNEGKATTTKSTKTNLQRSKASDSTLTA